LRVDAGCVIAIRRLAEKQLDVRCWMRIDENRKLCRRYNILMATLTGVSIRAVRCEMRTTDEVTMLDAECSMPEGNENCPVGT
jgi:hypothetical protein